MWNLRASTAIFLQSSSRSSHFRAFRTKRPSLDTKAFHGRCVFVVCRQTHNQRCIRVQTEIMMKTGREGVRKARCRTTYMDVCTAVQPVFIGRLRPVCLYQRESRSRLEAASDQPVLDGHGDGLTHGVDGEFIVDLLDMRVDGVVTDSEPGGHHLVAQSVS